MDSSLYPTTFLPASTDRNRDGTTDHETLRDDHGGCYFCPEVVLCDMRYYRLPTDTGSRLVAHDGQEAYDLSTARDILTSFSDLASVAAVVDADVDEVADRLIGDAALVDPETVTAEAKLPVIPDEVWAAGVTYEISGDAREEESGRPDIYQSVYENDRPELFFKATPSRTVGPEDCVGIRTDSEWDVPEPELGVVLYRGTIVGYTVGNDVSSRSLEGENPLYLPQAKVYDKCCALGPCVTSAGSIDDPHDLEMAMTIERDDDPVYDDAASTSKMVRTCEELTSYLTRCNAVPEVAVLLTGTCLVPPDEFTLQEGDRTVIEIEDIGTLTNVVETVQK